MPGARLTLGTVGDDPEANRFELTLGLESRAFNQGMGNGLVLIGPPSLGGLLPVLPGGARSTAVVLQPADESDRFELSIPAGLTVDELPPSRSMEAQFGRFDVKWVVNGNRITRTLTLRVDDASVPASDYALVRRFIDTFREAESLPVVLVRRR